MVLADLTIEGRPRKVIMQAPKNGFFYVLDRLTGEFISGAPFVNVTWATGIDAKGRPIETPQARYGRDAVRLTPGPGGAHHWPPMAWNPATKLAYFAGQEVSSVYSRNAEEGYQIGRWNTGTNFDAVGRQGGGAVGGAPNQVAARPAAPAAGVAPPLPPPSPSAPPGRGGFLVAWDPIAQKERWRLMVAGGGGSLSTAANLLFGSDGTGKFFAVDAATGERLWETQLFPGIATPVTYMMDGKQYVSVMSGSTRGHVFTFVLDGTAPMPSRTRTGG
jgi:quinohemoprotein ethanol dehydrogenase